MNWYPVVSDGEKVGTVTMENRVVFSIISNLIAMDVEGVFSVRAQHNKDVFSFEVNFGGGRTSFEYCRTVPRQVAQFEPDSDEGRKEESNLRRQINGPGESWMRPILSPPGSFRSSVHEWRGCKKSPEASYGESGE
jgi:hypothetical protein